MTILTIARRMGRALAKPIIVSSSVNDLMGFAYALPILRGLSWRLGILNETPAGKPFTGVAAEEKHH